MHKVTIDGQSRGFYSDEADALDALLEQTNAHIDEVRLTPDRLTALQEGTVAFSDLAHIDQVDWLYCEVEHHCPTEEIAREAVAAEMEHQTREVLFTEYEPPADAVPWDSDDYEYEVRDWFDTHVNQEAFDAIPNSEGVVKMVRDAIITDVRDRMAALWDELPHTLADVDGVGTAMATDLWERGYRTPVDLQDASRSELADEWGDATTDRIKADVGD